MQENDKNQENMPVEKATRDAEVVQENSVVFQIALEERENEIKARETELKKKEESLVEQEQKLSLREQEVEKKQATNEAWQQQLQEEAEKNQRRSANLTAQEKVISISKVRQQEEAQQKLATEIQGKREQYLQELRTNIERERKQRLASLNQDIKEERENRQDSLKQEIEQKRQEQDKILEQERQDHQNKLDEENKDIEEKRTKLQEDKEQLKKDQQNLKDDQEWVKFEKGKIEEQKANWDNKFKTRCGARIAEFEEKEKAFNQQLNELRQALLESENRAKALETANLRYEDLTRLEKKIQDLEASNKNLYDELNARPSQDVAKDCERYKNRVQELEDDREAQKAELEKAASNSLENESLHRQLSGAQAKISDLEIFLQDTKDRANDLQEELNRLRAAKITPADRERRMESIMEPYLSEPLQAPKLTKEEVAGWGDEMDWLDNIAELCTEYGVKFPKRILEAYHTSLKIANWSSITVLAGVSGTGKSELPHLYARFGGLNFINVPVQPNWDSQESMLGFFNSIDNKFDAQPILRFLYQCENEELSDTMSIVLLDEMNLAHVEHYFADFLSKLEMRRSSGKNVPNVDVSLGAGVAPYKLPLSRNVLYCGTMNQDETTKALSDKVLDRGIVIFFPRPRHLYDRNGARTLDYFCKDKYIRPLPLKVWDSWREKQIAFTGQQLEELNSYRTMLEEINNCLAEAGRAIGHRVWQSIEHYVMNHPRVRQAFHAEEAGNGILTPELREAMHTAVEDQLVQKVMPKLRGIDTMGRSRDKCLDPIRTLLLEYKFNLDNDFGRACEMGYGQFMWCSADYIEDEEHVENGGEVDAK